MDDPSKIELGHDGELGFDDLTSKIDPNRQKSKEKNKSVFPESKFNPSSPRWGVLAIVIVILIAVPVLCSLLSTNFCIYECFPPDYFDRTFPTTVPPITLYCQPACWNGLVPGKTTTAQTEKYLSSLGFRTLDKRQFGDTTYQYIAARRDNAAGTGVETYSLDGRLRRIEVTADFSLSLSDIIEKFGPPKYYRPSSSAYSVDGYIYYPEKGYAFALSYRGYSSATKRASTCRNSPHEVYSFNLVEPTASIDEMLVRLHAGTVPTTSELRVERNAILEWPSDCTGSLFEGP